jgi:hypothetical protein
MMKALASLDSLSPDRRLAVERWRVLEARLAGGPSLIAEKTMTFEQPVPLRDALEAVDAEPWARRAELRLDDGRRLVLHEGRAWTEA